MDVREEIKKTLQNVYSRAQLPRDIDFFYEKGRLTLLLGKEAIGFDYFDSKGQKHHRNMQEDKAAFEGWAIVIKAFWKPTDEKYNVSIDISDDVLKELPHPEEVFINKTAEGISAGHYGRFLYRAYKFAEEFNWFELSDKIQRRVNEYRDLLDKYECTNHLPDKEAGINKHKEIQAECSFSKHPNELKALCDGLISGDVYRQLGCRLEDKNGKYKFFTGGRSAMDLWNLSDDILNIFELKAVTETSKNRKVGIITELFFYVEYCQDMFGEKNIFTPQVMEASSEKGRGYGILYNAQIRGVRGFFLTNKYHPLIKGKDEDKDNKVLEVLKGNNNSKIEFVMLPEYNLKHMLDLHMLDLQKEAEKCQG
jgi:hypothetical protein